MNYSVGRNCVKSSWAHDASALHVGLLAVSCHCHDPLYVKCQRTEVQIKVVPTCILGSEVHKNIFFFIIVDEFPSRSFSLMFMIIHLDLCTGRVPSKTNVTGSRVVDVDPPGLAEVLEMEFLLGLFIYADCR